MIRIHLISDEKMSNRQWYLQGKPYWWVRIDDEFLKIPKTRGDKILDVYVDINREPPFTIHFGVGPRNRYGKRYSLLIESNTVSYSSHNYEDSLEILKDIYPQDNYDKFQNYTYLQILETIQTELKNSCKLKLDQKAVEHYTQRIFDSFSQLR